MLARNVVRANARQAQIRRELRREYAGNACNESYVARLRHEMSGLPHRHEWLRHAFTRGERECGVCWAGTDFYMMPLADILAEIAESERRMDEIIASVYTQKGNRGMTQITAEPRVPAHFGQNADAYRAGLRGERNSVYTQRPGPDRTAFTAGWVAGLPLRANAKFSRGQITALADMLRQTRPDPAASADPVYDAGKLTQWQITAHALMRQLAAGNPNFDRERFLAAIRL